MLRRMSDAGKSTANRSTAPSRARDEEAKINAPDRATLFMLSAVCLATLTMWATGRAACNYRVKGESLQARSVSVKERTTTAQSTAFEWAQAMQSGRFSDLEQLTSDDLKPKLSEIIKQCTHCDATKPYSVATLIAQGPAKAQVQVETWVDKKPFQRQFSLESNVDGRWQVTEVVLSTDSER